MHMSKKEIFPNYIRVNRKKTALSQRELGMLVGYADEGQVSRHEHFETLPPFVVAVAYEVIFRVPITDLFPAVRNRTQQEINRRINVFKEVLEQQSGKERSATATARKLEWIAMLSESVSS